MRKILLFGILSILVVAASLTAFVYFDEDIQFSDALSFSRDSISAPAVEELPDNHYKNQFSVWAETDDFLIKATPHTTYGGYVYVDIVNKMASDDYNIVWGFENLTIPGDVQYNNGTDWVMYDKQFSKDKYKNKETGEKDKDGWYLDEITLTQNVPLTLRFLVPEPEAGTPQQKYDIGFYPSSYGKKIDDAVTAGEYYVLDPWIEYGDNDFVLLMQRIQEVWIGRKELLTLLILLFQMKEVMELIG